VKRRKYLDVRWKKWQNVGTGGRSCKQSNETSDSIKCVESLGWVTDRFLRRLSPSVLYIFKKFQISIIGRNFFTHIMSHSNVAPRIKIWGCYTNVYRRVQAARSWRSCNHCGWNIQGPRSAMLMRVAMPPILHYVLETWDGQRDKDIEDSCKLRFREVNSITYTQEPHKDGLFPASRRSGRGSAFIIFNIQAYT
jgi:hypothetical protein